MLVHVKREDGTWFQATLVALVTYTNYMNNEVFIVRSNCEFERVFMYKQNETFIICNVNFPECSKEDPNWVKKDSIEGYKEFIDNPNLLDRIRNKEKNIFPKDSKAYSFFNSLIVDEEINYGPIPVNNKEDIDNLLDFAGHFHDGVISDVIYNDDKTELTLEFIGIWGIEKLFLHFKGDIFFKLYEYYQTDYFYGASIFIENNKICFVNEEDMESIPDNLAEFTIVSAESMSYSFDYKESKKKSNRGELEILKV